MRVGLAIITVFSFANTVAAQVAVAERFRNPEFGEVLQLQPTETARLIPGVIVGYPSHGRVVIEVVSGDGTKTVTRMNARGAVERRESPDTRFIVVNLSDYEPIDRGNSEEAELKQLVPRKPVVICQNTRLPDFWKAVLSESTLVLVRKAKEGEAKDGKMMNRPPDSRLPDLLGGDLPPPEIPPATEITFE